jgi:hypothetical protein
MLKPSSQALRQLTAATTASRYPENFPGTQSPNRKAPSPKGAALLNT